MTNDTTQYHHDVIMHHDRHYKRLVELQKQYPELTFNNDGYEKLSPATREKYKEQMKEISDICTDAVLGFREFNHFVLSDYKAEDPDIGIRIQYMWDSRFRGVGYFDIDLFKEETHEAIMVTKLTKLGYDGADLHRLMQYFEMESMPLQSLDSVKYMNEMVRRKNHRDHIDRLIDADNKKKIDEYISKARLGETYYTQ